MSIEAAIVNVLRADSAVAAIVAARIYPHDRAQDGELPGITYQLLAGREELTLGGPLTLNQARISVTSWSESYSGVRALSDAVVQALNGYTGTAAAQVVHGLLLQDESAESVPPVSHDDVMIHGMKCDFLAWFDR